MRVSKNRFIEPSGGIQKTFYHSGWAKYDLAVQGTLELLPIEENIKYLKDDYAKMKGMIFGDYPSWEDIFF